MRIGIFTATFLDMKLEEVFKLASGLGYRRSGNARFCQ